MRPGNFVIAQIEVKFLIDHPRLADRQSINILLKHLPHLVTGIPGQNAFICCDPVRQVLQFLQLRTLLKAEALFLKKRPQESRDQVIVMVPDRRQPFPVLKNVKEQVVHAIPDLSGQSPLPDPDIKEVFMVMGIKFTISRFASISDEAAPCLFQICTPFQLC